MSRSAERRKKQRKRRKSSSKGAPATHQREAVPKSVPPPSALVEETAAPVKNTDGLVGVERATRLEGDERPPTAIDVEPFARLYEQAAASPATRRLYLNRLTLFLAWCAARDLGAMPAHPEVLRRYFVSLATEHKALSTLDVSLAAILMAHRALGLDAPVSDELRATLRLLRSKLTPRSTRSTPVTLEVLRQLVASCGRDPFARRDRALILVTYFAGLRRAEAAGLNREAARRDDQGYQLTLESTELQRPEVPTLALHAERDLCPVRALDDWLVVRAAWAREPELSSTRGPLFVALHRGRRSRLRVGKRLAPNDIDRIVKRRAAAAGLNPSGLSAASLRTGFHAEAARSMSLLDDVSSAA